MTFYFNYNRSMGLQPGMLQRCRWTYIFMVSFVTKWYIAHYQHDETFRYHFALLDDYHPHSKLYVIYTPEVNQLWDIHKSTEYLYSDRIIQYWLIDHAKLSSLIRKAAQHLCIITPTHTHPTYTHLPKICFDPPSNDKQYNELRIS